ncbi:phosphatase domain-containing protein [Haliangium sp.]|uniref:phosphatase domain-containing protein n=1 Tax=Haliangium sp. TaxID=2663208 RepID=UPI003D0A980F
MSAAPYIRHVIRLDLDKTYLRSEFDTLTDLVKSAMESPTEKQAFPGAPALLRSLRQSEGHRVCIVSGSPTQMRRVLAAKLALDGVEYDEFVLKNNLRNLLRGRFRAVRAQVPYKLPTLLASRAALHTTAPETLFGDDAEADAIVYCLYADIIAGKVPPDELERILVAARAYDDDIAHTIELVKSLVIQDSVQRILIHLDQRSPTASFARYGARLVPIFNYFQAALVLYADGVLSARQVLFVAREMLASREFELTTLANSMQDLLRRGRLLVDVARRLAEEAAEAATSGALSGATNLPPLDDIAEIFRDRVRQLGGTPPLEWPAENPQLDYVSLVDAEHHERREKKRSRIRGRRR